MNNYQILAVDDEIHILNSLKRLFRKEGYKIFTAISGKEGLVVLNDNEIHLILSDQRMPEMNGVEFLQQVKNKYPESIRVVLSGYADEKTILDAINKGEIYRFFPKPWNDNELKTGIRQCLEHYELNKENQTLSHSIKIKNDQLEQLNNNLEDIVEQRTQRIELLQDMFELLPIPVLGISIEKFVVLFNDNFKTRIINSLNYFSMGEEISNIFPKSISDEINYCLLHKSDKIFNCKLKNQEFLLNFQILTNEEEIAIGGLLIFEEL